MATKNGKMLKDFLQDCNTNINNNDNNQAAGSMEPANSLPRSRSWSRSRAALTSFQKLLKSFHQNNSSSAVTPSTIQRSVSKKLLERLQSKTSKRSGSKLSGEVSSSKIMVVTVRVKDILRWKSFRVVEGEAEEEVMKFNHCQPLDDEVVGPANDAGSSSSANSSDGLSEMSWGESEFTAVEEVEEEEDLPCCGGEEGKKWEDVVDDDGGASDSEVGPNQDKHNNIGNEEGTEQQSPISVLNSPFRDEVSEEELPLSFEQKMANMERTKQRLLQSIQWFEDLAGVHDEHDDTTDEDEPPHEENESIEAKSKAYPNRGFSWFNRGSEGLLEKKECMEKLGQWNKFEEERTELGVELEDEVLSDLLDEVISDFCG